MARHHSAAHTTPRGVWAPVLHPSPAVLVAARFSGIAARPYGGRPALSSPHTACGAVYHYHLQGPFLLRLGLITVCLHPWRPRLANSDACDELTGASKAPTL